MSEPDDEPPIARTTYDLDGHTDQERQFDEAFSAGRAHHAWLMIGPRGVGKATFAYRAARRALGAAPAPKRGPLGAEADDPVCQRIEAESHGDLLVLERPIDPKKNKLQGEIPVDAARRVGGFFASTANEGGWRVCLVDAADDMNVNAANALLKTLEEPPNRGLLLLVAHTPGLLPATIRSRCRTLTFTAPGRDTAARVAARAGASEDEAQTLAALADGRPGLAALYARLDAVRLHDQVRQALTGPAGADAALADAVSSAAAEPARDVALGFVAAMVAQAARDAAASNHEAAARAARVYADLTTLSREMRGLYLDPRATVLDAVRRARDVMAET